MKDIPGIDDREGYIRRLSTTLVDKLFFVDKVDAKIIVDYGCGDGLLLRTLASLFPDFEYIGFDSDSKMLSTARARQQANGKTISYFGDWEDARRFVAATRESTGSRVACVLSSVVHEMYHYLSAEELDNAWGTIWAEFGPFDYVCMRDMMASETANRQAIPEQCARVRQLYDREKLREWQKRWGRLEDNKSLLHFLLTYTYTENWRRELAENYFPMPLEAFMRSVPPRWFEPIYVHHFVPPFLRRQVRRDFGFDVPDPTHVKIIWERR